MLRNLLAIGIGGWATVALVGCGGQPAPVAPAPAPAETTSAPAAAPSSTPASPQATAAGNTPATGAASSANNASGGKETKWIGSIPYDVFYDQPLSIASDTSTVGIPAVPSVNSAASTAAPAAMAPAAAPVASGNAPSNPAPAGSTANALIQWGEVIPLPILMEEVKLIRTRLTSNLQTVATFNKSANAISTDAAILAALASVAERHPESAPWKANAAIVRDLAAEICSKAEGTGRTPFTNCKEPFDKLIVLLDGGKVQDVNAKEQVPFSDAVYVADMMKRIEVTFNGLKANFNTPARLKEDPATVERELRVLEMLGTMMSDHSYDSAEEENYQKLTRRFIEGTQSALQSAKTGDLDGYQGALNKVQTTCAECHQEYRGSNGSF